MIGVFDSGAGGLAVVREVKRRLPDIPLIYFGDTARAPWGNKSPETVRAYAEEIVRFLMDEGAERIVIACNTASTFASASLRKRFPAVPFHDVIAPVINVLCQHLNGREERSGSPSIGVIGTRGTIGSGVYGNKLRRLFPQARLASQACPLFVPLAEEGLFDHPATRAIAGEYLAPFRDHPTDALILGCTHYPLFSDLIQETVGKDVILVSSAEAVALELAAEHGLMAGSGRQPADRFYFSDIGAHSHMLAERILGKKVRLIKKML